MRDGLISTAGGDGPAATPYSRPATNGQGPCNLGTLDSRFWIVTSPTPNLGASCERVDPVLPCPALPCPAEPSACFEAGFWHPRATVPLFSCCSAQRGPWLLPT